MRTILPVFFLLLSIAARAQDSTRYTTDTLIGFWGTKPVDMGEYENRQVPYDTSSPLYVCINYKGGKYKNKEFFRSDSNQYLEYDFFKNGEDESQGMVKLTNDIIGKSYTIGRCAGCSQTDTPQTSLTIYYYKRLVKEGKWTEYQDTFDFRTYWTGQYKDDKRIGIWTLNSESIDSPLEAIDYAVDSTKKIYTTNLAYTIPIDSLALLIANNWMLIYCDDKKTTRMVFSKMDGSNGYDLSNANAYYSFSAVHSFKRKQGDGCNKFKTTALNGKWKLFEKTDGRYIMIRFTNNTSWILKILYIDSAGNLETERLRS